jgi:hypothetical protein
MWCAVAKVSSPVLVIVKTRWTRICVDWQRELNLDLRQNFDVRLLFDMRRNLIFERRQNLDNSWWRVDVDPRAKTFVHSRR